MSKVKKEKKASYVNPLFAWFWIVVAFAVAFVYVVISLNNFSLF